LNRSAEKSTGVIFSLALFSRMVFIYDFSNITAIRKRKKESHQKNQDSIRKKIEKDVEGVSSEKKDE